MKSPRLLKITGRAAAQLKFWRDEPFFKDRLSLWLVGASLALNILNLLVLLTRVRPSELPVPVHYLSPSYDALGPWYQVYGIWLFSLGAIVVNCALAVASFGRSRITSFFLTSGAFVVALFCLIISAAFATVV